MSMSLEMNASTIDSSDGAAAFYASASASDMEREIRARVGGAVTRCLIQSRMS